MGDNVGSTPRNSDRAIVMMGPAGSGKTTVGRAVADALGGTFVDADDHHSAQNRAKMNAGVALTDQDRAPWLEALSHHLHAENGPTVVMACSALRADYRLFLNAGRRQVHFVHLDVPREELSKRLELRAGHFAGLSLLTSQLRTWEPLNLDSDLVQSTIDGTGTVAEVVARVLSVLSR